MEIVRYKDGNKFLKIVSEYNGVNEEDVFKAILVRSGNS